MRSYTLRNPVTEEIVGACSRPRNGFISTVIFHPGVQTKLFHGLVLDALHNHDLVFQIVLMGWPPRYAARPVWV